MGKLMTVAAATLLIVSYFQTSSALAIVNPDLADTKDHNPLRVRQDTSSQGCGTQLNKDLYGFGVRLGLYFTWATSYIANNFVPEEVSGALDNNSIFLLALGISVLRNTWNHEFGRVDALVLLELSAGTVLGVMSLWGYRTCHYRVEGPNAIRHYGGFGTHLRLILCLATNVYGLWFWFVGINGELLAKHQPGCRVLWIFDLPVRSGIRYAAIVICLGFTVYWGVMLLVSSIAAFTRVRNMIILARGKRWATSSRLRYTPGLTDRELRIVSWALMVFNLIWLILICIIIELTLHENHNYAVLAQHANIATPPQLIPLLIGACSFVRILCIACQRQRGEGDIEPSLGLEPRSDPEPKTTSPHGRYWFQIFSPAMRVPQTGAEKLDGYPELLAPRWKRLLVAWLPWLTLLDFWNNDEKDQRYKAIEDAVERYRKIL